MNPMADSKIYTLKTAGEFASFQGRVYAVSMAGSETYLLFSDVEEEGFFPRGNKKMGYVREVSAEEIDYGYAIKAEPRYGLMKCSVFSFDMTENRVTLRSEQAINQTSVRDRDSFLTEMDVTDPQLSIRPITTRAFALRTLEEFELHCMSDQLPEMALAAGEVLRLSELAKEVQTGLVREATRFAVPEKTSEDIAIVLQRSLLKPIADLIQGAAKIFSSSEQLMAELMKTQATHRR